MKTKIIPFDAKIAKDIQDGKIEGKIVCYYAMEYKPARIICWDRIPSYPIVALVKIGSCFESVFFFSLKGDNVGGNSLFLEVPDKEPQFKPFDKVLVTQDGWHFWIPSLYRNETLDGKHVCIDDLEYDQCIPYEGNEHLVYTTDKPKGE